MTFWLSLRKSVFEWFWNLSCKTNVLKERLCLAIFYSFTTRSIKRQTLCYYRGPDIGCMYVTPLKFKTCFVTILGGLQAVRRCHFISLMWLFQSHVGFTLTRTPYGMQQSRCLWPLLSPTGYYLADFFELFRYVFDCCTILNDYSDFTAQCKAIKPVLGHCSSQLPLFARFLWFVGYLCKGTSVDIFPGYGIYVAAKYKLKSVQSYTDRCVGV